MKFNSDLKRKTPLRRRTCMKPISDRRRKEMAEDCKTRRLLCERAGGEFIQTGNYSGYCRGGTCEHCHGANPTLGIPLSPHELIYRSRGGKLSLENSEMRCIICHRNDGHNDRVVVSELKWSKGGHA